MTCVRRTSSPSTSRPRGGTESMSRCCLSSTSGSVASTAFRDTTVAISSRVLFSVTRPRVTRETSSRSSTRRTMCLTWRMITSRSC